MFRFRTVGAVLTLGACLLSCRILADRSYSPPTPRTLTTVFTYKATVPEVPSGTKSLRLWIPIPSNSEWQTIEDVQVEAPAQHRITTEPKYSNRMVALNIENPTAPVAVTVKFKVTRKEVRVFSESFHADQPGPFASGLALAADSKVPTTGRFADMAKDLTAGKTRPLDQLHSIFEYVVANMQYDYKKESPRLGEGDVAFVCDYKKGNCSDLHSFIISMARSLGIPAVLEFGFPVCGIPVPNPIPKEGTVSGYHCWTWFKDPEKGWAPLDASDSRRWADSNKPEMKDYLFGNLLLERSAVAFSRGRDITLNPPQTGPALNYFIYPYAEADGSSIKVNWEVKYTLPGAATAAAEPQRGSDVQAQIDELKALVKSQAQEIARLRDLVEPKKTAAAPAPPVTVPSRESITTYGFLRFDADIDNGLTNNSQIPFFVQSPGNPLVAKSGNRSASYHPRLTRIGWNFAAPKDTLGAWNVGGKFEMDWQNGSGLTTESRPLPRIRHAYLTLGRGANTWLFGQTWDLISPLFPSPNDDTLMWNAGNLGDRRPQVRYTYDQKGKPLNAAVALGLTGAIDAKDLDANTVRDGEDSGLPNIQARVGVKGSHGAAGIWGHRGWERTTKVFAGGKNFDTFSVGLDFQQDLMPKWDIRGEAWTGSNLSDFRGGIAQGVNPAGKEIHSRGGWAELGYQSSLKHRLAIGYTRDDPTDSMIPAGGRTENWSLYLHNRWKLAGNLEVGANYLYWLTRWKGLAAGVDHRINAFIQHNF